MVCEVGNQMGPCRLGALSLEAPLEKRPDTLLETTSRVLWLEISRGHWVCPEVGEERARTGDPVSERWESSPTPEVVWRDSGRWKGLGKGNTQGHHLPRAWAVKVLNQCFLGPCVESGTWKTLVSDLKDLTVWCQRTEHRNSVTRQGSGQQCGGAFRKQVGV